MRIGIKSFTEATFHSLKREYLLYDQVHYDYDLLNLSTQYVDMWSGLNADDSCDFKREIELLTDKGILVNSTFLKYVASQDSDAPFQHELDIMLEKQLYLDEMVSWHSSPGSISDAHTHQVPMLDLIARSYALSCEQSDSGNQYTPIVHNLDTYIYDRDAIVADIVLSKIPVISSSTCWDKLIDFKTDSESVGNLLSLRNWMIDITHTEFHPNEINERLDYLLHRYESSLKIHQIECHQGKIELFVILPLKIIENILKLKFSSILKDILDVRTKKLRLDASELNLAGREVAYISNLRSLKM